MSSQGTSVYIEPPLSEELALKILKTVDRGLTVGEGVPLPGRMCVEAAVCYALRMPHGDNPSCVGDDVRNLKIELNDQPDWGSKKARAEGLRKLAVAQLGSNKIDQGKFSDLFLLHVAQDVIPHILDLYLKDPQVKESGEDKHIPKLKERFSKAKTVGGVNKIFQSKCFEWGYYTYLHVIENAYLCNSVNGLIGLFVFRNKAQRKVALQLIADAALKALIKLKSPGCKWLYLCDQINP